MPAIIDIRDQIQTRLRQYHHLKAQIEVAESQEEARLKTVEANKLLSQINTLRLTLTKLETQQRQLIAQQKVKITVAPKTASKDDSANHVATNQSQTDTPLPEVAKKSAKLRVVVPEDVKLFEDRISHIELSQKKTREKLKIFTKAKDDLTRLKEEAEQHALHVTHQSYLANDKLQQEIARLNEQLQWRESQYETLKQECNILRYQVNKDADSMKEQLEVALEKQKQLEKERSRLFRSREGGFTKGLVVGLSVSIFIMAIAIGIAIFSGTVVCHLNSESPTAAVPH